jgi:NADH:ubiquinone reductase (H+-translocating)
MQPHVIVIGGGYAGVMAARTAADHHARVTVIDPDGQHDFLPRLATVAAGVGPETDARASLTSLLHGIDVHVGAVAAIDPAGRLVKTASGGALSYDGLVVAAGAHTSLPGIPGLDDHAWTLWTADDALRLRTKLAASERVVVVGAGATGTQLAAEVAAHRPGMGVTLVEAGPRILPSLPRSMAARARAVLHDRGVDVRTGIGLAEVAAHAAVLHDGTELPGVVVWAGGSNAPSGGHALLPDADAVDGRVVVDRCAQVGGHGPVFAAGDVAVHRGPSGEVLPQTAQVAVRAGALAGANAVRVADGRRPRPSTIRHIGWVVPLGGGQAVAKVGPLVLADPLTSRVAPVLHDVIDLRHLFTVGGLPAINDHHQC